MMKYSHVIFFDGKCGLCDHAVQIVLKADKEHLFAFAPLQGVTAQELLRDLPESIRSADSLILVENYKSTDRQIHLRSKAILRICWLLGGWWALIGWKYFLPAWLFDWAYRIVATNRHRWFKPVACVVPDCKDQERFLP